MTNGEVRMSCSVVGTLGHWTCCLSFEHKKCMETNQLALQVSAEDARDMWLSYIMMRKSEEVPS